jgi:pyridoxal phosphate enzyme (YggS family)
MAPADRIADNVARVRDAMAAAAVGAGRDPASVRLVAVTKYVDAAMAAHVLAAGCSNLAESRPQELWAKAADVQLAGAEWHLVGRLQRNKIRRTLPLVKLIHSVDSERLIEAIDGEAKAAGVAARVLLEVNCGGEAAKQGFAPGDVPRILPKVAAMTHVHIAGMMTMAPLEGGDSAARRAFAALRELRDKLAAEAPPNVTLDELSMGMSGDFPAAIVEGATIVRIGSTLFEGVTEA